MSDVIHNMDPRVFVRIKPREIDRTGGDPTRRQIIGFDEGVVRTSMNEFDFPSRVFGPEVTQVPFYEATARPLVELFTQGHDVNLIALGQTGSGKSHTIFGPPRLYLDKRGDDVGLVDDHGVFVRAALDILSLLEGMSGIRWVMMGTMIEVGFKIRDLRSGEEVSMLKTGEIVGAYPVVIETPADVFELAKAAEGRATASTRMNDTSSRSHCVTTLTLLVERDDAIRINRFRLFDFMGSERAKGQNSAYDERLNNKKTQVGMEGIMANFTLHGLRLVAIGAAKARRAKGVAKPQGFPLTDLLVGSLYGKAATVLILALSLAHRNGDEAYRSLELAQDLSVMGATSEPQPMVSKAAKVKSLKHELATAEMALKTTTVTKYKLIREAEVKRLQHWLKLL